MYRLVPLLAGGAIVLILLPAPPPPVGSAAPAVLVPGTNLASALAVDFAAPTDASAHPTDGRVTLARENIAPSSAASLGTSPNWPQLAPVGATAIAGAAAPDPSTLTSEQVGSSALNVRADPSAASAKLFVLAPGEDVKVGETDRGWAHIYRADGQSGWVFSRYLTGGNGVAPPPDTSVATNSPRPPAAAAPTDNSDSLRGRFARIGGDMAVRAAPQSHAPMLFMLDAGERVRISQSRGRWLQVVTENGDSGWIPS
jgi:SH3-like domain-containing protein